MKIKLDQIFSRVLGLCLLAAASAANAASGTWTSTAATGNWSDIANWNSGAGPIADGTDAIADFSTLSLVNAVAVTQDTPAGKTIGGMKFGSTGGVFNWTLTALGGTNLNLAVTTGYPTITVVTNTVNINLPLAGANGLMIVGPGTLSFGANQTYTNITIITNGATVQEANQYLNPANTVVTFYGGTLVAGNSSQFSVPTMNFPAGQTGSLTGFSGTSRYQVQTLTGSGTANIGITCTSAARTDLVGNSANFSGIVNLTGAGQGRMMANGGAFIGFPNAAMTMNSACTLQVNLNTGGNIFSFGSLSGTSPGANIGPSSAGTGNGTLVCGSNNATTTFAGTLSGNVAVTKVGTGTMTFTNNSTLTGPVLVTTGAVFVVTGGSFSNSTLTVATNLAFGGAAFGVQVSSPNSAWTVSNLVLRSGSILSYNFGTVAPSTTTPPLRLLGALSATNTVTVNLLGGSGWVQGGVYPLVKYVSTNGSLGSLTIGALPLRVTGVLSNDVANSNVVFVVTAVTQPLRWATTSGNWDISTTSNWRDAAATLTTYQQQLGLGDQVVFEDSQSGAGPITVSLVTNVTPASVTVSNVTKNYTFAGSSNIVGTTSLTKAGAGTLTIQNTNSFTGAVNVNGGVLNFASLANNLGAGTAINFNGGTLQYAAGNTADISARTVTLNAGGATMDTAGNNVAFASRIGNSGAGGLTKTGAGTLTLNTNSTYTGITVVSNGVLALGANTSLSNSAAVVVSTGATLDASATGFGFNLNGTGGQMLAGNGAVSGAVTTSGGAKLSPATNGTIGTLTFNNDLTLNGGTFNLDVNNGSRDLIAVSGFLNLNATVSGTVQINALALLTLNSTNKIFQYPAGQLTGGGVSTLSLAVSGVAQSGRLLTLDNSVDGEIDLVVHAAPANNLTWFGDGGANAWDVSSANWTGVTNIYSDGDNANFTDAGAANSPVNISSTVTPNSVTFNATLPYTLTGAKITGPATVTKTNSGTVILANVGNDYGMTVIKTGTLQIGDGSTAGTSIGQGTVTNNAALVFNQPDNSSVLGDINGTGSLGKQGAGTLTLLGNNTYAGATTVDTGVLSIGSGGVSGTLAPAAVTLSNGGTLDLNHSGTYSVANGISGAGALKFDGAATVTLGGVNSYLNNTYINNGVVKLSAANVIPSGGSTTGWLILDGGASAAGALDLNGFNQSANALSGLGGTVQGRIYNNGSGQNTLTLGTIASTTYAGLILNNTNGGSGSLALTVTGDGSLATALTLSGANSYTGPVYLDGASVIMGGGIGTVGQQSIGTGAITLTNGGSLQMNGYGNATQSGNFVNNILVPAGTTGNLKTVGRGNYNGSLTVHGTLNLTTSYVRSTPGGDWSASDGQINIIAGGLGGDVYLINAGNINWGTAAVDLGAGVAVYNSANTGVNGNTFTIGELTGSGSISDTSAGTAGRVTTYVVGGRNTSATFAGTIFNRTRITAINKVGSGSWTLNGTDTYTGATTVSGGSLIVGPSSFMTASTPITVNGGTVLDVSSYAGLTLSASQTLAGSGVVTGLVTAVASDILSPGVGALPGTLSFSNSLTLTGDFVTNNFNLSSDPTGVSRTNSQVVVAGDLNVTGSNIVTINPLNSILGAGSYTLFKFSGALMTNGVAAGNGTLENNFTAGGAFPANSHVSLTFSNTGSAVVMIVTPAGNSLVWSGGVFGTATNNWDLNLSTNWLAGATTTNFLTYDNVTFNDTATNFTAVVAGTIAPGAVTVGSTNVFTFSGTGKISGTTGLTKNGTNVLTISNTGGNDYTGTVTINNGTVKAGSATALGATNGATVVSGTGALDVGGQNLGAEPVTVSGSGLGGAGAIQNSGAAALNALQYVTLAGNATFGGTNRWDIRANTNGSLAGGGFTLTKTSANDIYLVGLGNTALGNLQIQQGRIGVQDSTLLGSGSTLTLFAGAGLDFWNNSVTNTKAISLTNATISSSSGTNVYGGTINLNGTGTFTATTPMQLNGALGGTGGLVKNGASPLTLTAANNYSGVTTVSNGILALVGTASIASSTAIEIESGAVLDVIGHTGGSITLASGQTLRGNGTVSGSVSAPAGSTVSPGVAGIGTLTITNTITLGGTTLMEVNHDVVPARDQIVATNIVFGGTLTVVQSGSALTLGDFFKLFVGAYSGSFAVTNLPALDPGLAWTNTLALNGTISVVAGPSVNTGSTNITSVVNGNNLELSWPADHIGWKLQAQTNTIATGLSNNWVTIPGTETDNHYTNAINPVNGSVFYRMVYP